MMSKSHLLKSWQNKPKNQGFEKTCKKVQNRRFIKKAAKLCQFRTFYKNPLNHPKDQGSAKHSKIAQN